MRENHLECCWLRLTSQKKEFFAFLLSELSIIPVFLWYVAFGWYGAWTSIADIGCFVKTSAPFTFEIQTVLAAGRVWCVLYTVEDDLATGFGLSAVIPVNTEILQADKVTVDFPHAESLCSDLFGDSGWGFSESLSDAFACHTSVEVFFNVTVCHRVSMFLIA